MARTKEQEKIHSKKYYAENKEKILAKQRQRHLDNPEYRKTYYQNNKKEQSEYYANKRLSDPLYDRRHNLKLKYKITLEEYDLLYNNQHGCCAICNRHQSEFKKILAIDHNHTTNKIRGLLCSQCNTALGLLNDNIDTLQSAIMYLKSSS